MENIPTKVDGVDVLPADQWNQVPSEIENAILNTGITLSSGDLFQLSKSIANYVASGSFYSDSGTANAYVLSVLASKQSPTSFADGLIARFVVGNTNTGSSTVNVATLGVKNVFYKGVALSAGTLTVGDIVTLAYDLGNDRFNFLGSDSIFVDLLTAQTIAGIKTFSDEIIASGGIQTDGVNTLKTKVIDIGDWNMDTTAAVAIAHGVTMDNIRTVEVLIRNDTDSTRQKLTVGIDFTDTTPQGFIGNITTTLIDLWRLTGGGFDNTNYDLTSYNRGWIKITYIA